MLSITLINAALSVSVQRFISFMLGKKDLTGAQKIVNNSYVIFFIAGMVVLCLFSLLKNPAFEHVLNISTERIVAAKTIYHCMLFSVTCAMMSIPFEAVVCSYEDMGFVGIIGLFESFGKLAAALYLKMTPHDRLISYGVVIALVIIIRCCLYIFYVQKKFPISKPDFKLIDKACVKEIASFSLWNSIGTIFGTLRIQGVAFLHNVFFGALVNAAHGIAVQVGGQINTFTAMMLKPMNPQIMESEGAGDRERIKSLFMVGTKLSCLMTALLVLPLYINCDYVLQLWLGQVPEYAVEFCRWLLIIALVKKITAIVLSIVQADGQVKTYYTVFGVLQICLLIVSGVLMSAGYPPVTVYAVMICMDIIQISYEVFAAKKLIGNSIKSYLMEIIIPFVIIISISLAGASALNKLFLNHTFMGLLSDFIFIGFIILITSWILLFNREEKSFVKAKIHRILRRGSVSIQG